MQPGSSAELSLNECGDATTGFFGHLSDPRPRRARASSGSVPDGRTSTRPVVAELGVDALDRRRARPGSAPCDATRTFAFACAKRGITAAASLSVRPSQRGAEQQRRREPVAGDVVAQADHVARLLAAEHAALAPERLEHVAVADVGRDARGSRARAISLWKPWFVICVTATRSTSRCEREDRDDAVAVDEPRRARRPRARGRRRRRTRSRGRSRRSATSACEGGGVGRAAADVDVRAVGLVRRSRATVGAEPLERARREARRRRRSRSRARCAARSGRRRSARARSRGSASAAPAVCPTSPLLGRGGASSSASISSSAASGSLRPRASKNFTPLYSGGLCEAEMTTPRSSGGERDGRRRQHAAEHRDRRRPRRRRARTPPRARARSRACRARRRRARAPLQSVAARPSRSTRSSVRNSPTTPRTPSVPKYRRAIGAGA